jgi:MoaA/NifB/PqqE/SkfB family radical SAM enzyme
MAMAHAASSPATAQNGELRHLWLELARKCNLQCVHCYASAGPTLPLLEGLTTHDWIRLLHEARSEGCKSVQFIGGEPLLHPALEALLQTAHRLGYESIEVFTNGTLLSPKWLSLFSELGVKVAFSFYHARPEAHDAITGVRGSHHRTLKAIDRAVEAGIPVRVGIVRINQTDEEVEELREFLKARGVRNIGVDRARRVGRADSDGSYKEPLRQLEELCGACHNGNLCVTATGEAYPCIMARAWPVGNVREGLRNVLHGQALLRFRTLQRQLLSSNLRHIRPQSCKPDVDPIGCLPG